MDCKKRISDYLSTGAENALSLRELCSILGLTGREIRLLIQQERSEGTPILSDCKNGYFLPEAEEDTARFVRSMRRRAVEICRIADAVENGGVSCE